MSEITDKSKQKGMKTHASSYEVHTKLEELHTLPRSPGRGVNVTALPACDDGQEPSASDADNALPLPQHGALCQQTSLLLQPGLVSQPVCFHGDAWLSQRVGLQQRCLTWFHGKEVMPSYPLCQGEPLCLGKSSLAFPCPRLKTRRGVMQQNSVGPCMGMSCKENNNCPAAQRVDRAGLPLAHSSSRQASAVVSQTSQRYSKSNLSSLQLRSNFEVSLFFFTP